MASHGYLLGYDIGSSSVKASLLEIASGAPVASATSPSTELEISAPRPGWAEQRPATWWEHVKKTTAMILEESRVDSAEIGAIGISYQMHGLVIVDKDGEVLRPSIIWCDSRAVPFGEKAMKEIGEEKCLRHLLNSPGNFTAAKLGWVKEHEPDVYRRIHKIMLPGDYIAMKLTGRLVTTPSGVSEGIMWDFPAGDVAGFLLDSFGFDRDFLPEIVPTFSEQGQIGAGAAEELGLKKGTPVSYRGGDQPNNALSLNVLNPGEVAATAGTSGVVYGVADRPVSDSLSRVNTFVHVNYSKDCPRYGVLLCVNGTGILNSWVKHNLMTGEGAAPDYARMDESAAEAPVGSEGLVVLPYGNGAERTLGNRSLGGVVHGLDFNTHSRVHFLRAVQEGIVFALNYGVEIMRGTGAAVEKVRAGNANMFISPVFREAFATVTGAELQLYETDGAQGAARGAGIGAGIYKDAHEAFKGLGTTCTVGPSRSSREAYREAYGRWSEVLSRNMSQ